MFNYKLNYCWSIRIVYDSIFSSMLLLFFFILFYFYLFARVTRLLSFRYEIVGRYIYIVEWIFAVKVSAYEIQLVDNGKMLENTN